MEESVSTEERSTNKCQAHAQMDYVIHTHANTHTHTHCHICNTHENTMKQLQKNTNVLMLILVLDWLRFGEVSDDGCAVVLLVIVTSRFVVSCGVKLCVIGFCVEALCDWSVFNPYDRSVVMVWEGSILCKSVMELNVVVVVL